MESERFRPLATVQGPFVSVYLDDSRDTADAVTQLDAIWRDLRKHLEDHGADHDVVVSLEHAILHGQPAVGRQGRGVIATHERVLINEHLLSPPPATVLRISDYPYILPLVEFGMWRPMYVFAAVDHAGADITLHQGDTVRSETVDGGGYPVHKPVTAGWSGYGDFQRTTEEAIRMNVRAVADRAHRLVDETGAEVVFVCGEVRSRTDVVSALPDRVAARVSQLHAGARGHRVREDEIGDLIDAEFEQRRRAAYRRDRRAVPQRAGTRIRAGRRRARGGVRGAAGGRRRHLDRGRPQRRHGGHGEDRTTIAPNADVLSELGEAPYRVVRADEALPFAAITIGASVVRVDDRITPAGRDRRPAALRPDRRDRLRWVIAPVGFAVATAKEVVRATAGSARWCCAPIHGSEPRPGYRVSSV